MGQNPTMSDKVTTIVSVIENDILKRKNKKLDIFVQRKTE
jgi:hypothetical protein